nr:GerMN domain-containing protein [Treponema sp.]
MYENEPQNDMNDMNDMEEENGKGTRSNWIMVIIWILCFVAVSVVFLVKLDDIKSNLKNTRFFERVFGTTPSFIENYVDKTEVENVAPPEKETVINIDKITDTNSYSGDITGELTEITEKDSIWSKTGEYSNEELDQELTDDLKNLLDPNAEDENLAMFENRTSETVEDDGSKVVSYSEMLPDEESSETVTSGDGNERPASLPIKIADGDKTYEEVPVDSEIETSQAKLWFTIVDDDGRISRKQCVRRVVRSTAPLTTNLKMLLQGPNSVELDAGCMSLIPSGTRLLTAIVKDNTAYLNFSREFEENRLGVEGFLSQLQQIVFTSTEFATVKNVQILIEGKKKDTLGDGVWVGSPLSRADFR